MFRKSYEKLPKHPYTVATCPFCSQYVFPGAYPEEIGHEETVWCDNCEQMFKRRPENEINENIIQRDE